MIPAANVEYMWNSVVLPRLGVAPYDFGGSFSPADPSVGTDCSGAVSAALGALVNGPAMAWPRQFWTGTFSGATVGSTGPYGGVAETAQLVCIAQPTDAPADAAMIIAVLQDPDPSNAHMICRVQGIDIEMGGNEIAPNGQELDYHTNLTNPNSNSVMDTSNWTQWFYLPGLDPSTPPPPGAPPPPAPVLYGIDISNNNFGGPDSPDLASIPGFVAEVVKEGFSWIEAKVSEGSGFVDPTFPAIYQACQANNIICVGYHYVDTSDPHAQAQNFKNGLKGASVPVMLDWENGGGDFDNYESVWFAFNDAGLTPALEYIPHWYWQQEGSANLSAVKVRGLVSSSWVDGSGYASNLYPGPNWPGWDSYGNTAPAILQFTSQANVAGKSLDADAFRGSLDDLKTLFGLQGDGFLMALTQAQQEDVYNGVLFLLQAVTGNLSPAIGQFLLPGSPTPVGADWGPEPNLVDQVNALGQNGSVAGLSSQLSQLQTAVNNLNSAVSALSADFTTTSTGLAVLQKLAELNNILTKGA